SSRKIIDKIPSRLDKPKRKSTEKFSVEHAKDTQDMFKADEQPQTIKHEALGIKIEVKRPQFDANYQLTQAYNAMVAGNTQDSIEIYKDVLQNDPNNKNALFGLATLYHRAGQLEQARPYYGKLISLDPSNRDALNNFLVLLADEAPEEALNQLKDLQQRNPN